MEGVIECLVPCISAVPRLRFIHEVEAIGGRCRANLKRDEGREAVETCRILEAVFCASWAQVMWT